MWLRYLKIILEVYKRFCGGLKIDFGVKKYICGAFLAKISSLRSLMNPYHTIYVMDNVTQDAFKGSETWIFVVGKSNSTSKLPTFGPFNGLHYIFRNKLTGNWGDVVLPHKLLGVWSWKFYQMSSSIGRFKSFEDILSNLSGL